MRHSGCVAASFAPGLLLESAKPAVGAALSEPPLGPRGPLAPDPSELEPGSGMHATANALVTSATALTRLITFGKTTEEFTWPSIHTRCREGWGLQVMSDPQPVGSRCMPNAARATFLQIFNLTRNARLARYDIDVAVGT